MRKDIFIENNITKNFVNPLDTEYKRLIAWLMRFNPTETHRNAYLVVSNKLIAEYQRTAGTAHSAINITVIINQMTREGRLIKVSNEEIKAFKREHFKAKVVKNLTCNQEDRDHIPVVLLSERKYVLSLDMNFVKDLLNFPGFTVRAERRPQDLPYQ